RHHRHRQWLDAALDGDEDLSPQSESATALGRIYLRRRPAAGAHRQRELHAERRRLADADPQRPGAAGPAIFFTEIASAVGWVSVARDSRRSENRPTHA